MDKKAVTKLSKTIRLLERYEQWREGILDEWSGSDVVPPGAELTVIMKDSIAYLHAYKDLVCQPKEKLVQSNICQVWSPTMPRKSKKRLSGSN